MKGEGEIRNKNGKKNKEGDHLIHWQSATALWE